MNQILKTLYCGNITSIAKALSNMHQLDLRAIVYENPRECQDLLRFANQKQIPAYRIVSNDQFDCLFDELGPMDLGIVANFGLILSENIIQKPRHGFVNAHPGILPLYKGRTPVTQALKMGETEAGLTLHRITPQVDEGPILDISKITITQNENPQDLAIKLYNQTPSLLDRHLNTFLK